MCRDHPVYVDRCAGQCVPVVEHTQFCFAFGWVATGRRACHPDDVVPDPAPVLFWRWPG